MHPLMIKNFGNWKYHDRPRPGVLHHVAHSGDEIWTVRVGTQRQLGPYELNLLCDIIDKFGEGYRALHHPLQHGDHGLQEGEGRAADRGASKTPATRSAAPAPR